MLRNNHTINTLIQSGHIKRCHTQPGPAYQTTGHHSFEVALLLEYIYPDCTKAALLRALTHDSAELVTGDVPAPVKRDNPVLAQALADAEAAFDRLHGIDYDLAPIEHRAVKLADMLSLLLFSRHQQAMGNTYFEAFEERLTAWFYKVPNLFTDFPKLKEFLP
jgi:5'-deoxynucleotidase YfbR-like HD superfamily hydrolase